MSPVQICTLENITFLGCKVDDSTLEHGKQEYFEQFQFMKNKKIKKYIFI